MSFNVVEYLTNLVNESAKQPDDQKLRVEFEERAAILEYDGGLSRDDADHQALAEIKSRMKSAEGA